MATIKLSDYIMEQNVSMAECSDIVLEQLQAEIDVNLAIADAYAKQILMMEYASDYVQEADDSTTNTTEKKDGKFKTFWKTIWKAIKGFFSAIGQKISAFWEWIKMKLGKGSSAKLREIAEKASEEEAEKYLEGITKDFDVIVGKGGRLQPHLYDSDAVRNLIDVATTWVAEAAEVLKNIDFTVEHTSVASKTQIKDLKSRKWDLTKSGKESSSKATLAKMADFVKWMETEGETKLKDLRVKLQELNPILDKVEATLDKVTDEEKQHKRYAEYVSLAKEIKDAVAAKSVELLQSLGDITAMAKAIDKAVKDFNKAKATLKDDAEKRKAMQKIDEESNASKSLIEDKSKVRAWVSKHEDDNPQPSISTMAKDLGWTGTHTREVLEKMGILETWEQKGPGGGTHVRYSYGEENIR